MVTNKVRHMAMALLFTWNWIDTWVVISITTIRKIVAMAKIRHCCRVRSITIAIFIMMLQCIV